MNRIEELRAAILGSDDLRREPADVPWELGGEKVYVSELTQQQRDAYVAKTMPDGEADHFVWSEDLVSWLVCRVLVTETGERIFADSDADALGAKSSAVLLPLFNQAMRLSGMDKGSAEKIKEDFEQGRDEPSSSG
jgi:hypothetical protein